jgi:hypothetical protein
VIYLDVSSRNGGIDGEVVRISEQSNKHTYLKIKIWIWNYRIFKVHNKLKVMLDLKTWFENWQMNLDQSWSDDYKLRNINTEMRHYKCLASERLWITRRNGYRIAGAIHFALNI